MDELYNKIFDDPRLKEGRLSSEHFVKDMDLDNKTWFDLFS